MNSSGRLLLSFVLQSKTNVWHLYEMQHWAEMGNQRTEWEIGKNWVNTAINSFMTQINGLVSI